MCKLENKKTRCLNIPKIIQGHPKISSGFFLHEFEQHLENVHFSFPHLFPLSANFLVLVKNQTVHFYYY